MTFDKDQRAVLVIHVIGSFMAFGLIVVYTWLHVILSFITRPQLSSLLVCWIRTVLAFIATIMFPLHLSFSVFHLFSQRRISDPVCRFLLDLL